MAHFLHPRFMLPLDVLRLIFEFATANDKRTGVALSVVSKKVQRWYVARHSAHAQRY